MQAFRIVQDVSDDGFIKVQVPASMGRRVEVILLPVEFVNTSAQGSVMAVAPQENSGFCTQILAAKEEDVWNDL